MSKELGSQSPTGGAMEASQPGNHVAPTSRRQALLGGARIGAAAFASAAPLKSHAAGMFDHACTLSGQMSAAVSARPNAVSNCQGYMPSHYFNSAEIDSNPNTPFARKNWPNSAALFTTFNDIFSNGDNTLLAQILKDYRTDGRAWWVAAYFTALQRSYPDFIYTAANVKSQFAGTFPSTHNPAPTQNDYLNFYRDTLLSLQ